MTLAWYFEDERTEASLAVLEQVADAGAVVPALWRLEVLNGLQVAVRRGRIDSAYRDASLTDLQALVIAIDPDTNRQAWSATLRLCDRFGLTSYDAAYLELAQRLNCRSLRLMPRWPVLRALKMSHLSALSNRRAYCRKISTILRMISPEKSSTLRDHAPITVRRRTGTERN